LMLYLTNKAACCLAPIYQLEKNITFETACKKANPISCGF
jgi:hypothetical protein